MSSKEILTGTTLDLDGSADDPSDTIIWVASYAGTLTDDVLLRQQIPDLRRKDLEVTEDMITAWNAKHGAQSLGRFKVNPVVGYPNRANFDNMPKLYAGRSFSELIEIVRGEKREIVRGLWATLT